MFAFVLASVDLGTVASNADPKQGPARDAFRRWAFIYRSWAQERFRTYSRGGGDWRPLALSTIMGRRMGRAGAQRTLGARFLEKFGRRHQGSGIESYHLAQWSAKIHRFRANTRESRRVLDPIRAKINAAVTHKEQSRWRNRAACYMAKGVIRKRDVAQARQLLGDVSILYDRGLLFVALNPSGAAPGGFAEFLENGIEVGYGGPGSHGLGRATIADIAAFHDQGMGRNPKRTIIAEPPDYVVEQMSRAFLESYHGAA